jgi:hypothetical protein
MDAPWLTDACSRFQSRRLFYPSAGADISDPIHAFVAYVDEFWFVDSSYDWAEPLLAHSSYRHDATDRSELSGITLKRKAPITVRIRSESYTHLPTGRIFVVNACCGRGYDTFRAAFRERKRFLSVFFYRGDSPGESGSGFDWLKRKMIRHVFAQLDPNAIIVSDGSNAIPQLSAFHRDNTVGSDAVAKSRSFTFLDRQLTCIGYLGERYGPTLVWRADVL